MMESFWPIHWSLELIATLIIVGAAVMFVVLERYFPYTKGVGVFRKGAWVDFVWYTLIQSFFLKILIFDWIIAPLEVKLGIAEEGYLSHWPIWALVLFFLITHDFYIYWFHRFQHSNKWLWRTHEAHHSVENVDWLAGSRSHMGEILINQTIEFLPIFFLLNVETAAVVVLLKALFDALLGQFIHANIHVKMGALGYVINGPELHQWHHADHPEVYHKNFGTKLSLWDWLFGTAYLPSYKPQRFGVWYRFPRGWVEQHVFSVYRFHVGHFESSSFGSAWVNLRNNLLNRVGNLMPRRWQTFLFPKGKLDGKEVYGEKPELNERLYAPKGGSAKSQNTHQLQPH